jgi:hypothetical protein
LVIFLISLSSTFDFISYFIRINNTHSSRLAWYIDIKIQQNAACPVEEALFVKQYLLGKRRNKRGNGCLLATKDHKHRSLKSGMC